MTRRSVLLIAMIFLLATSAVISKPAQADTIGASSITQTGYDIYSPSVLKNGQNWRMWSGGWKTSADQPNDKIFYSTSSDGGHTWTIPVLNFEISGIAVNDPSVIQVTDSITGLPKYLMYFTYANYNTDSKNLTGLATSSDGINWTNHGVVISYNNGLEATGGAWAPSALAADPNGNTVYVYYFSDITNGRVLRSTLTNGGTTLSSTIEVVPVDNHSRLNLDVSIAPNGTYWMFYDSTFTTTGSLQNRRIEKMYSTDGLRWKASKYNPVQESNYYASVTPNVVWTSATTYALFTGVGSSTALTSFYQDFRHDYTLQPERLEVGAAASTEANGAFAASNVIDSNPVTAWSSTNTFGSTGTPQWVSIDIGSTKNIYQVKTTTRTYNGVGYCYPVDFKFQSSPDNLTWTDIPGQTYTSFADPGTFGSIFNLATPLSTRYVRMYATKFRADPYGNYYFQLGELAVEQNLPSASDPVQFADANTLFSNQYPAYNGVDGNATTWWSSAGQISATAPQYLSADLAQQVPIASVTLTPRVYNGAAFMFPIDFAIQYSLDDWSWWNIPGQIHTGYVSSTQPQVFNFSSRIVARYVRVISLRLAQWTDGYYYMQIAEISARNS